MIEINCYACTVGVATGPESHDRRCPVRHIPMPAQDGQWGPEWTEYDRKVAEVWNPKENR